MKFLRVEVDNWRPFRGISTMDIASADDQPITLVFGKNGGGKTSMLNAIYWCLYGEMDLEEGKGTQNRVNDYAVQENGVTKDNPVKATVTLYTSHTEEGNTRFYRIERSQRAYDDKNGVRKEEPDALNLDRITPYHSYRPRDDIDTVYNHPNSHIENFEKQQAKEVIERLLPKGLAKYFFYPGETLSFPFKDDQKSRGLLQGFLREISGGNKFDQFVKLITQSRKSLDAKSKAYAEADNETRKLQKEIDILKSELTTKEEELPRVGSEQKAAETNYQGVLAQLQELEALQEVLAEAETARANETKAELEVSRAEQGLSDALGGAYLDVALPVFDAVYEVFDKRSYPNDISNTLVEQMRESMECICGRELTEQILKRLEPLSPTDDSVINRMISLRSYATSLRNSAVQRSAMDAARVLLNDAIQNRSKSIESRAAAEARLTETGADQFNSVEKSNLVSQRSKCLEETGRLDQKLAGIEGIIQRINEEIVRKEDERKDAAPKIHQDIHRAATIAREMHKLLDDIKKKQADVARQQLEDLINQHYVVYKENISVQIDKEFRVKVCDNTGDKMIEKPLGDLSGSEIALLTYAFAAAAAKLLPQYQTLDKLLTTVPDFGDVENIPLVVDAPFASLGDEYKRRVLELISKGFSQVVMFTESADTEVLEEAEDKIGAEYLVHFEGDLDENVDRTFTWRNKTYTYASPNSAVVRSTLERIEN